MIIVVEIGSTPCHEPVVVTLKSFSSKVVRVEPDHTYLGQKWCSERVSAFQSWTSIWLGLIKLSIPTVSHKSSSVRICPDSSILETSAALRWIILFWLFLSSFWVPWWSKLLLRFGRNQGQLARGWKWDWPDRISRIIWDACSSLSGGLREANYQAVTVLVVVVYNLSRRHCCCSLLF